MGRRKKPGKEQLDGVLVLNKPSGPTSTDCLNDIKHQLKQYRIGHAGTLDPLAQGVLVVLLGRATKIASYVTDGHKVYLGTLLLGRTTDTWDIQGETVAESSVDAGPEEVHNQILAWKDLTEQAVPAYSAAKHKGKPLYALAREGREVPEKTKPIVLSFSDVVDIRLPEAEFRVGCSAGTYIRSLVHSLGMRLGCGAVLTRLVRERSEPFGLDQAHELADVLADKAGFAKRVIPLAQALPHWRTIALAEPLADLVRNGGRLPADTGELAAQPGERAMFLDQTGDPVALAEAIDAGGQPAWAILRGLG